MVEIAFKGIYFICKGVNAGIIFQKCSVYFFRTDYRADKYFIFRHAVRHKFLSYSGKRFQNNAPSVKSAAYKNANHYALTAPLLTWSRKLIYADFPCVNVLYNSGAFGIRLFFRERRKHSA